MASGEAVCAITPLDVYCNFHRSWPDRCTAVCIYHPPTVKCLISIHTNTHPLHPPIITQMDLISFRPPCLFVQSDPFHCFSDIEMDCMGFDFVLQVGMYLSE